MDHLPPPQISSRLTPAPEPPALGIRVWRLRPPSPLCAEAQPSLVRATRPRPSYARLSETFFFYISPYQDAPGRYQLPLPNNAGKEYQSTTQALRIMNRQEATKFSCPQKYFS